MNIGVDIRCLMDKERTGVGEYTFGLLEALFKIDKNNQYYLFYNSNKDVSNNLPHWDQENVHFVGTKYPNKILNLLLWLKIVKLDKIVSRKYKVESRKSLKISNFKFQIDHWFSPNLNFTNLSRKVKHIQTIHDLSFEFIPECFTWKQRLWHWFLNPKKQCQKADIILAPSESTRQDVVNKYRIADNKIQVLRPGISLDYGLLTMDDGQRVREKYNLPERYILYLGTLEPRKNIEAIIEAYKMNYELGIKNYELVVVGAQGWKNKELLELIENTPGVKYIGYVAREDKQSLYSLSSLFVFPSLYEGFGLPVLEAMSLGVPVITSNRTSLPEVVGTAGYSINPHNVLELTEAMKLILSDEKLHSILLERGKKQAEKFNWNNSAKDFLNLLYEDRN